MKTGPDVSMWQGDVDWQRVKRAGHDFAIAKCSEGEDYRDPTWSSGRVEAIRQAGLQLGAYHFLRPRRGRKGDREARWAVKVARSAGWGKPGDLALVCDVETTELDPAATARYVKQFCRRVEQLTGRRPIIYTFPAFAPNLQGKGLGRYPLWIAHWGTKSPTVPAPWKKWVIHQHTETGSCPGISGSCDLNRARRLPAIARPERREKKKGGAKRKPKRQAPKPADMTIPELKAHRKQLARRRRQKPEQRERIDQRIERVNAAISRKRQQRKKRKQRPAGAPADLPSRYYKLWRKPWLKQARKDKGFRKWLWRNGYLSPNFTRHEARSKDSSLPGCGNRTDQQIPRSKRGKAQGHAFKLERVRHKLGDRPMTSGSWYRSGPHNGCVGSRAPNHPNGWATDWFPEERARLGGERFDRAMMDVFRGKGGVGYQGFIGGPVRHVDDDWSREWIYT